MGLVEREWLDTVSTLDSDNIDYTDYVDAGAMLAEELKRKGEETVRIDNVLFQPRAPPTDLTRSSSLCCPRQT